MSIQLGQLDTDCGGISGSPPTCSETCYAVAASVRAASLLLLLLLLMVVVMLLLLLLLLMVRRMCCLPGQH